MTNPFGEFIKNQGIGSHNLTSENIVITTREVGHPATCLLHNKCTGCHIPGFQVVFVKGVEPSAGQVGQIGSSRTQAAHAMAVLHEKIERFHKRCHERKVGIGESGGNKAVGYEGIEVMTGDGSTPALSDYWTQNAGTGNTGSGGTEAVTSSGAWRVAAAVFTLQYLDI